MISSLIRRELVQVYHHHLFSRVPLNPACHIIYPGEYLVWGSPTRIRAWVTSPSCGLGDTATYCALLVAHRVGQAAVPSFHLVTGQIQVLADITVDIMQMFH